MPLFAARATPYSPAKFAGYLMALAVLAGASLVPRGPAPPVRLPVPQDGKAATAVMFDVVRFGMSADEVLEGMRAAGVPYFLRQAGVTGEWNTSHPGQLVLTLSLNGQRLGRYIERAEPIDADRTRAYFGFESADPALLRRLAAPVDTTLDPPGLLRAIEAEHVRASLYGDGFRLSVLKPDAPVNLMSRFTSGVTAEARRDRDDFPLEPAEYDQARVREAYREEAARAGDAAALQ